MIKWNTLLKERLSGMIVPKTGQDRFIILTTAANVSVERVHDRMPLILEKQELEEWVYDEKYLDYALHKGSPMLQQYQPYVQQSLF